MSVGGPDADAVDDSVDADGMNADGMDADGMDADAVDGVDAGGPDEVVICATCGTALDGLDRDEDPTGDRGRPICGNCDRERNFFDMDSADRELDDEIDD